MIIRSINNEKTTRQNINRKPVPPVQSFGATPKDILSITTSGNLLEDYAKRRFAGRCALFFFGLKAKLPIISGAPEKFIYNLKGKNVIPKELQNVTVLDGRSTLGGIDEVLRLPSKSDPDKTKGEVLAEHLKGFGVENPDYIEITKAEDPLEIVAESTAYDDFVDMLNNQDPIKLPKHNCSHKH